MKCLEGFHLKAAHMMTGLLPNAADDDIWFYSPLKDVWRGLAGLYTINHYVEVHRQTITSFILHWPIFDLCTRGVKKRGYSIPQFWWEQTLDLEVARASAMADAGVVIDKEEKEFADYKGITSGCAIMS